jgi:chemotaxis family two-component system response regulator Rcp1
MVRHSISRFQPGKGRLLLDKVSRILLVEDNEADVYLFRKALENADLQFELTVMRDGAEALAFVRREGKYSASKVPNLVLLDLNLPKDGGIQVLRAIREREAFSNVPVAIVSSSASPQDRHETDELGVDRYVTKPPNLEEFLKIGQISKELLYGG